MTWLLRRQPSRQIQAIAPHPMGGLVVTFTGGARYHYPDAPEHLAEKVREAPSQGSAFHNLIRRVYKGTRL